MPAEVPSLDTLPLLPDFQPVAPQVGPKRSRRGWIVVAAALLLVGGGAGVAVAATGGTTGATHSAAQSTPTTLSPRAILTAEAARYEAAVDRAVGPGAAVREGGQRQRHGRLQR